MTLKIAVITPYYQESSDYLWQCHHSVCAQSYPADHILVADGMPRVEINRFSCYHIILPYPHHDIGSTPRVIGAMHAIGMHYDFITFLDADNWFAASHLETLIRISQSKKADIVSSNRMLCRIDGSPMAKCPFTNPDSFIDTNCMLIGKPGFHLIQNWILMPEYGHLIGDRIFWYYIRKSSLARAHSDQPTVFYRCQKEGMYQLLGENIPKDVRPRPNYELSHQQWLKDGNPPLLQTSSIPIKLETE